MQAGRNAGMAAMSSLEAVRRKIRSLQEQADTAEERAGRLQREVDQERALREEVGLPVRLSSAQPGLARGPRLGVRAGAPGGGPGARQTLAAPRPAGRPAAAFGAVSDRLVICRPLRSPPRAAGRSGWSRRAAPGPQVKRGHCGLGSGALCSPAQ